jgi:hypothetical protein
VIATQTGQTLAGRLEHPLVTPPIGEGQVTQQQAADLLNVGKRSVERAVAVRDHGTTNELKEAVERGRVSVSVAASAFGRLGVQVLMGLLNAGGCS